MCHSAEEFSRRFVFLAALKRTIQATHLCGDVPCIELLGLVLEIVTRSLAFTMCAVLIGVLATLAGVLYCCAGSRRQYSRKTRMIDLEEQQHTAEPVTILDFQYEGGKTKLL